MALLRGTLVSFNPATGLASLRVDGSDPQTLDGVTVSSAIRPEVLVANRRLLVDTGASGEPGELWVVAVDGLRDPAVARAAALLDIVNTAAESTVFSATVPANALGTDRAVRALLTADYLNNTGANQTVRLRVKYGATTLYDDISGALATNAARRAARVEAVIAAQGSASVQSLGGSVSMSAAGGATAGLGDLAGVTVSVPVSGAAAENSANTITFAITITHSVANAALSFRRQYAVLESV
ncbi:MAG: hypothetical protein ACKVT1_07225 [Dehalococcoidia bacterium]